MSIDTFTLPPVVPREDWLAALAQLLLVAQALFHHGAVVMGGQLRGGFLVQVDQAQVFHPRLLRRWDADTYSRAGHTGIDTGPEKTRRADQRSARAWRRETIRRFGTARKIDLNQSTRSHKTDRD